MKNPYKIIEDLEKKNVLLVHKAAMLGDRDSQWAMGDICYFGEFVKQDYKEAVRWWRKAASQGCDAAQCSLGLSYYNGWGVAKDDEEAKKWFRKAALQGHGGAKVMLENFLI